MWAQQKNVTGVKTNFFQTVFLVSFPFSRYVDQSQGLYFFNERNNTFIFFFFFPYEYQQVKYLIVIETKKKRKI